MGSCDLGGGFKDFFGIFTRIDGGEMIQFDLSIFFRWVEKNHQIAIEGNHPPNQKKTPTSFEATNN